MAPHTVLSLALLLVLLPFSNAQLTTSYYSKSCPHLNDVVFSAVQSAVRKEARMGASLLRLFFHDCFVNVSGLFLFAFTGEKNANPNRNSARGFEVIDDIKAAVEKACPGVVSCADVLAVSARDSTVLLGGPSWNVKLGRRDARTLNRLSSRFNALGLSNRDLVALSGSHTIGQARCTSFRPRIYNENNIDGSLARTRQSNCPRQNGTGDNNLAPLDFQTPTSFDNRYFGNLVGNRGLLHSDQQLFSGSGSTDSIVRSYSGNEGAFRSDFAAAMIKMGDISPLTGSRGEIRRNCRRAN
ncbi:Peroxidase 52 [Linum perenne]